MNYSYPQILVTEVPGEITLGISVSGCQLGCKGCHSTETWNSNFGEVLNIEIIDALIKKNKGITCVLFYGGEWDDNLIDMLKHIKSKGLKTALYSGLDFTIDYLVKYLDYYKIGPYIEKLGGLSSKITNQLLFKVEGNALINITEVLQKG